MSNFIDPLKYDWESLPQETKDEYYSKLAELIQNKQSVEKFEDSSPINTDYPNEFTFIVYFLTMTGFIFYFLNVENMDGRGHFYMAIYLIVLLIGTGAYYFSHR